jgi:hypothetical protein
MQSRIAHQNSRYSTHFFFGLVPHQILSIRVLLNLMLFGNLTRRRSCIGRPAAAYPTSAAACRTFASDVLYLSVGVAPRSSPHGLHEMRGHRRRRAAELEGARATPMTCFRRARLHSTSRDDSQLEATLRKAHRRARANWQCPKTLKSRSSGWITAGAKK